MILLQFKLKILLTCSQSKNLKIIDELHAELLQLS